MHFTHLMQTPGPGGGARSADRAGLCQDQLRGSPEAKGWAPGRAAAVLAMEKSAKKRKFCLDLLGFSGCFSGSLVGFTWGLHG